MIPSRTLEAIRARRARKTVLVIEEETPTRGKAKRAAEEVRVEESPTIQEEEAEE